MKNRLFSAGRWFGIAAILGLTACGAEEQAASVDASFAGWKLGQDESHRLISVGGFAQPEAVRYDPDQDVYFVANFNGDPAGDANGFVSRVSAAGVIEDLNFMVGTEQYPFHGGRGMFISGDVLWVVDALGVHAFNKRSGSHLGFTDFSAFEPGFLNDIVQGPDGALYVTDTPKSALYRMHRGEVTQIAELPFRPNGIALHPSTGTLVLAPWEGKLEFEQWDLATNALSQFGVAAGGGNFDGIEFLDGALISASQMDTSLHLLIDGEDRLMISLPGRPADIAVDTRRKRVAVPYIALNRVDIWELRD